MLYYVRLSSFLSQCHIRFSSLSITQGSLVQDQKLRVSWKQPVLVLSLKYHIISISLRFFISVGLAEGYLKASHNLRLHLAFLLSRVWYKVISWHRIISDFTSLLYKLSISKNTSTCNMAFLCHSTLGNLAQGQNPEPREVLLLPFAGLTLDSGEERNLLFYVYL